MTKRLFLIFISSFPVFLFAQSAFSDCDKVFTSVQHPPSLKISNKDFGDTLATELKSKRFVADNDEIVYRFVVTDKSKIDDIMIMLGNFEKEERLRNAILKYSYLWKPAMQNGYDVCSYVNLKIVFFDKKLNIEIIP